MPRPAKTMTLEDKVDLLLERQEAQDKTLFCFSKIIICLCEYYKNFHLASFILNLKSFGNKNFIENEKEFTSKFDKHEKEHNLASEAICKLINEIEKQLDIERFPDE